MSGVRAVIFCLICLSVALAQTALAQTGVYQSIGPGGGVGSGSTGSSNGVVFGPLNLNPPFPGGPLGSNTIDVSNGTINVWNQTLYGWGGSATALCVQGGIPYPGSAGTQLWACPVSGGFGTNVNQTNGSGSATYLSRDTVGAMIFNYSPPKLFTNSPYAGTFPNSTQFVPTVPLSAGDVALLRVGMVIDTNDTPTPYTGIINSWAANGTSITVQGWFIQGCVGFGCIAATPPNGTTASISKVTKIFGANIASTRNAVSEAVQNTTAEFDCNNNSGADDTGYLDAVIGTPYDGCIDAVNLGSNRASYGVLTRGKYVAQMAMNGEGTYGAIVSPTTKTVTYGYHVLGPTVSVGFSAQGASEYLRGWDASGVVFLQMLPGEARYGEQTSAAANYVQRFYTSARGVGSTDTIITYSGGTATINTGLMAVTTGQANFYAHVGTSSGSPPVLTACGTSPTVSGSDTAGTVTMGTGAPTGCVITFAAVPIAYVSVPYCNVTWQTNLASMQYTVTNAAITLVQTGTSSNKVDYHCTARSGG